MRLKIIGNEIIKNVGKYDSCMVYKLPITFKRTRTVWCCCNDWLLWGVVVRTDELYTATEDAN